MKSETTDTCIPLTDSIQASIALLYTAHKESALYPTGYKLAGLKEHVGLTKLSRKLSTLAIRGANLVDYSLYSLSKYPMGIGTSTTSRAVCICGDIVGDFGLATLRYHCLACKGAHTYITRMDKTYTSGFSLLTFRQVLENFCDQLNYDLRRQYPQAVPPTIHVAQLERLLAELIININSYGEEQ
jgi:hypothetical protein